MIHLTPASYSCQPWKNGKGKTVELWRREVNGKIIARLSRATVAEDGPFSIFPGIRRNLTVLTGAGFRLSGSGRNFRCDPFVPVAFPGAVLLTASETGNRPSDDFNVMTADTLPQPQVSVLQEGTFPAGGVLAAYALEKCLANDLAMSEQDLILTAGSLKISGGGPAIIIRFHGIDLE